MKLHVSACAAGLGRRQHGARSSGTRFSSARSVRRWVGLRLGFCTTAPRCPSAAEQNRAKTLNREKSSAGTRSPRHNVRRGSEPGPDPGGRVQTPGEAGYKRPERGSIRGGIRMWWSSGKPMAGKKVRTHVECEKTPGVFVLVPPRGGAKTVEEVQTGPCRSRSRKNIHAFTSRAFYSSFVPFFSLRL